MLEAFSFWLMIVVLAGGGVALLGYGMVRPEPVRNLADPVPMASLGPRPRVIPPSEPSMQRQIANGKNEAAAQHCQDRHEDCGMACLQYPKETPSYGECMEYCDSTRVGCMSWTHK